VPTRDIVVIGGSAGALTALRKILHGLPPEFSAAIFVVIHSSSESPGLLAAILNRIGRLPAEKATDGDPIRSGRVYVAPPDHHLLIKAGHVRVTRGPRENRFRPAVDPLFRTAAAAYGPRVIGVILSGGQDDGVLGLSRIKSHGGVAIVQEPTDAETPGMPDKAIRQIAIDHVVRADDMAAVISGLVALPVEEEVVEVHDETRRDTAEAGTDALESGSLPGTPSPFRCPECGGALWELRDGELIRFQCHVGHGFNGESLVAAQSDELEGALWAALRLLEENAVLRRRMADRVRVRGMSAIADSYEEHARDSDARAKVLRRLLVTDVDRIQVPSSDI
jgi:two-component system, chemotaxis family, protein-glutamate methylesterase/glutaminase